MEAFNRALLPFRLRNMRGFLSRLFVAITTFCLGVGLYVLTAAKPEEPPGHTRSQIATRAVSQSPPSLANNGDSSLKGASRVSQQSIITFPQIGKVHVSAHEDFGNSPILTFDDPKSGREILNAYVGRLDCPSLSDPGAASLNPRLRFKAISIRGLPQPLVIGVAICPGVSDSAWEAVAVGVVDGRLERLTFETMETSDEGGFFFGDLGQGIGVGAAQWDFVWGEDESHPPPHKYQIKMLKWDGRRFEWYKVVRTDKKYNSSDAALRASGFHFKDVRLGFPQWADLDSW